MKTFPPDSLHPKAVLAVGAHPDDIDFGASGALAKWVKAGAEVHYLVITDGSKGSNDPDTTSAELVSMREREQRAAADVLGAGSVHFFGYEDGHLEVTQKLKKQIVQLIRTIKPDTVITMDPTMTYVADFGFINHPDHRAAGQATMDAVFPLARDHLNYPDLLEVGLQSHNVAHLLLINLERHNFCVDITDTLDMKLAVLKQHTSQFDENGALWGYLQDHMKHLGEACGTEYAEAFIRIDIE